MKFLPEVGPGKRHNLLDFVEDPDYNPDPGSGLRSGLYPDRTDFHAIFYQRCVSAQGPIQ